MWWTLWPSFDKLVARSSHWVDFPALSRPSTTMNMPRFDDMIDGL